MSALSESQGDTAPATSPDASEVAPAHDVRHWIRWAGLAFAVLFVVGAVPATDTWSDNATDQEVIDWYASGSNRIGQLVGFYLATAAGLAFLVFSVGLSQLLPRASISRLFRALSQLFVTFMMAGMTAIATVSASVEIPGLPEVEDAALLRTIESLGFGLILVGGLAAAGAAVAVASFGLRGTGVLPSWLVVAGYVSGAVLLVGGVLFLPAVLLVLWTIAVAITARPAAVR